MKALDILNRLKKARTWEEYYPSNNSCKEAIKELEILNQNCKDCKHYLADNGYYPLSCGECSLFYGNKWESR